MRCTVQSIFSEQPVSAMPKVPANRQLEFRIGINVGDIIIDEGDIYGDGVNIAARIEALAEPGGICLSGSVYEHVRNKLDAEFIDLGEQRVKNIAQPVRVYKVNTSTVSDPRPTQCAPAASSPVYYHFLTPPIRARGWSKSRPYSAVRNTLAKTCQTWL